jgi:hypothetical protein|tara:strand:+ start:195 stop:308 length:114 start_codon:yes stop_codon:yes gene_type:complete
MKQQEKDLQIAHQKISESNEKNVYKIIAEEEDKNRKI